MKTSSVSTMPSDSRIIRMFVSVLLFCLSLTILYLSMRAVLNIGGFCAEGGPYEIAVHCPKGVPVLATIAPLVMMASLFLYVFSAGEFLAGVFLMWAGIFISLGWNFFDFAMNPPEGQGIVYAWLICAIIFGLMGIAPLLLVARGFFDALLKRPAAGAELTEKGPHLIILLLHLAGVFLGVGAGIYLFNAFTY